MGQKGSKACLPPQDLHHLIANTEFTEEEIKKWYKDFMEDCKSGKLSMPEFQTIYSQFFPDGDSKAFAQLVFRRFDVNKDGSIDFREFLCSLSATTRGELEDKLRWAFTMYDLDNDGYVTREELLEIVTAIYKMVSPTTAEEETPAMRCDKIMRQMDKNDDKRLSLEEFIAGAGNDPSIVSMLNMGQ